MNSMVLLLQLMKENKDKTNKDVICNLNRMPTFIPKISCLKCKKPKGER